MVRYPRLEPRDAECAARLKKRTLTNLYNERPAWLDLAHKKLDAAVAAAYGWPADLSDEQILDHPEMAGMAGEIERVLRHPQFDRRSRADEAVRLFYEFYAETIVGGKWLCIVVKYLENDAFVVTGYLTDKPKDGDDLWPTK